MDCEDRYTKRIGDLKYLYLENKKNIKFIRRMLYYFYQIILLLNNNK